VTTTIEIIRRRSAGASGLIADRSADIDVARLGWIRMGSLLAKLGNPQLSYSTIHVAGSKGKGTTTHLAAALLDATGYRTGRYTSPHLLNWNERIAVDDLPISDGDLDRLVRDVDSDMAALERDRPELGTFNSFELLTAAGFIYFWEQNCDHSVIEVGLGGRFDSTNHLHPAVTVITRIEREHAEILGPSLEVIAWNKAGIIRPGTPVVVGGQVPPALRVITTEAASAGAPLYRESSEWSVLPQREGLRYQLQNQPDLELSDGLPGAHNRSNLGAALTAVHLATGSLAPASTIAATVGAIRIPGRFDRRRDPASRRDLILDVAHTPESIRALIETAYAVTGRTRFPFVVGLLSDKPAREILSVIKPAASEVIFPELGNPRAVSAADLVDIARSLELNGKAVASALDALDHPPSGSVPIIVTGSFAIVSAVLRLLSDRHASLA
jgi:dihydrofolate synthase/folylpolyglutamate synthase